MSHVQARIAERDDALINLNEILRIQNITTKERDEAIRIKNIMIMERDEAIRVQNIIAKEKDCLMRQLNQTQKELDIERNVRSQLQRERNEIYALLDEEQYKFSVFVKRCNKLEKLLASVRWFNIFHPQ